ncbi:toll/interleukin-1 receptor domain-containing protein [Foetidibacter luteolus]|uniref:toll/interleukin-1 receptor domain-containing protein n=1 Tax=Foetidibacter luteolus TaxID=2608880 RepID=UPI00129A802D|nr:toll/interleukin-1 receptor domain-containing protein [Foetidibacter luteolus]
MDITALFKKTLALIQEIQKRFPVAAKTAAFKKLVKEFNTLLGKYSANELAAEAAAQALSVFQKAFANYVSVNLLTDTGTGGVSKEKVQELIKAFQKQQRLSGVETALPQPAGAEPPDDTVTTRTGGADGKKNSITRGGTSAKPKASRPKKTAQKPLLDEGKILYDIPGSMVVKKQQKCIVRIGKDEATIKDDDTFTEDAKVDRIKLAGLMRVELIDLADSPAFAIKSVSATEQPVDADSFTEWVFYVTPLASGTFPLVLKVSAIRTVDGKERVKDIVFEKPITIVSPQEKPAKEAQQMKDLSGEKNVLQAGPPSAFISYAHKDKTYFDIFNEQLDTHSQWQLWTDRHIETGSGWFDQIQGSVAQSDFAVLLVSAAFIDSSFIKEHEVNRFFELQKANPGFSFLPVLLRDVDFIRWPELAALQFFTAYGDEYGVPEKKGQLIPFAKLCRFDNNGQLIPNDNIDTYIKNFVKKAETERLKRLLKKDAA